MTTTPNAEHSYRRGTAYELIADLYRLMGHEDQIDALYTDAGLYFHAVMHRLAMDDVAPALSLAKANLRAGYDVRRTADALLETGHAGAALELLDHVVPLLEERTPHREDILTAWALAAARADAPERALEIAYQRFSEYPKVDSYRAVMAVAEEQGVANTYDRMMIDALEDDPRALTEVHIARRDIDAALAAYARITGWSGDDLTLRLAALARVHRPQESRQLIEGVVERRIARRSRRAYSDAAAVANRLREVIGEEEFSAYLEDLRSRYRHLPAFRDELNKAFGSSA